MSILGFDDEHIHPDGSTGYRSNCPDCRTEGSGDKFVRAGRVRLPSDGLVLDDEGTITLENYRSREALRELARAA